MKTDAHNQTDKAFEAFKSFKKDFDVYKNVDISESDTRSKVLDKLLRDVLLWREEDIVREGNVDSGYFDYKVNLPGVSLVVEAKRSFNKLSLPDRGTTISLQTLYGQNKEVIDQIRNYLGDLGLSKGIISNGHEFIIGTFYNVNGKPWKQNRCLLFKGLDDIEDRFFEFYDNISRNSVISNGGFKFEAQLEIIDYQKIINTINGKDDELIRNTLSSNIAPVIDKIFGEIFNDKTEDDIEFIKECFVQNDETKKNRDEIDRLFEDKAPKLSAVIPASNVSSLKAQIADEMREDNPTLRDAAPKPIVIVGSRGAGKTTFINHLFKSDLPAYVLANHPYVHIDFRGYYKPGSDVDTDKIIVDVLNVLYDKYAELKLYGMTALKRMYYKEIHRNDNSIWEHYKENNQSVYAEKVQSFIESKLNDSATHFNYLSQYLIREHRKRIVIIIDNADQFDLATQKQIFLFAQSINQSAQCGVVVSLREGYYYHWRNLNPFDAYESNVYHVSAPKYGEVLQKRIDFTLKRLTIQGESDGAVGRSMNLSIKNQDIIEFLTGLRNTLFSTANSPLVNFLKSISYPNIREGLRIFKLFLVSGHTNISEYILRERFNDSSYVKVIPIHEFVKSIGLNNKLYYNHEFSVISNLFYPCDGSKDHFTKIRILKVLSNKLTAKGDAGRYESIESIIVLFSENGFRSNIIQIEIHKLLQIGAIESEDVISDTDWKEIDVEGRISITMKGSYYVSEMMKTLEYIDMVLQDTPVYNENFFARMKANFPLSNSVGKRKIAERIATAEIFIQYLESEESKSSNEVLARVGRVIDENFIAEFQKGLEKAKLSSER